MILKKSYLASLLLGVFFVNPSYADIQWTPVENMLSNSDQIVAMTTYHDRVYIAGSDINSPPGSNTFLYAMQGSNNWLSVKNGLTQQIIQTFATYHDQLFAGGMSGFFVYNGNDQNPNWKSLSVSGLPDFVPRLTTLTVFQDKIYGIATRGDGAETGVYVYNDTTQNWQNISGSIPQSNVSGPRTSLLVFNNKLYWFYNFVNDDRTLCATMFVYNGNDAEPNWSVVYKAADSRAFYAMDVFNNTLIAGGNINSSSTSVREFTLAYNGDDTAPQWTDISGTDGTLTNLTFLAIGHDDHSLFIGGMDLPAGNAAVIYQFNGDFKNPHWVEADAGIKRYPKSIYGTMIGSFTNTSHGFFTQDFNTSPDGGSIVYSNGKTVPK